jgi:hypothetical protein
MSDELDEILGKMLNSMEANNRWDTEAYAEQALDYLSKGGEVNPAINRAELEAHLRSVVKTASEMLEAEMLRGKRKNDLIDEIVNFKG